MTLLLQDAGFELDTKNLVVYAKDFTYKIDEQDFKRLVDLRDDEDRHTKAIQELIGEIIKLGKET